MIRGIGRRGIFNDNEDPENLIERLSKLLPKTKTQCYAWVFMPNHTHFLFKISTSGIRGEETAKEEDYRPELMKF
jgi:REP element-mobilizing transposase RayT